MSSRKHHIKPYGVMIRSGTTGGILARLYRTILHDLGITLDRYNALMGRYIAKAHLDHNRIEKANARVTLSKELLKDSMTWKTFVRGLDFLNTKQYELGVEVQIEEQTYLSRVELTEFQESKVGEGLVRVFEAVKRSLGITHKDYSRLMQAYLGKHYSQAIPKSKAASRSSLLKEIARTNFTWTVFIKSMVFLGVSKMTIQLTLHHENGRSTHHQTIVVLDGLDMEFVNE
jgi:hypothetical protein